MPPLVSSAATIKCALAVPPGTVPLATTPKSTPVNAGTPAANIADYIPLTNIPSFGMCTAPTNPAVQAATSAAMGTPTPAPCIPAVNTAWTPGAAKVKVGGQPALHQGCQATCMWGGVITILTPGNEGKIQVS